jgi:hypothetical protein
VGDVALPHAVSTQAEVGTELVPAKATTATLDHERRLERGKRQSYGYELAQPDSNGVVPPVDSIHAEIVPAAATARKWPFRPPTQRDPSHRGQTPVTPVTVTAVTRV